MTATVVNGRAIATDILAEIKQETDRRKIPPRLDIFIVGEDAAIESFVARKRRSAKKLGFTFNEHRFADSITQEVLESEVGAVVGKTDAIVIQLPLPKHFNTQKALEAIPFELDVDVLTKEAYEGFVTQTHGLEPPVQGAVREIIERHNVRLDGRNILVIGKGHLVGLPVIEYFKRTDHKELNVADRSTSSDDFKAMVADADIIVSGTGVAGLIQPHMIKNGVVLLDAGTSGSKKQVVGDIACECEEKASLFSKTPGGIGPITVAILYKNLFKTLK